MSWFFSLCNTGFRTTTRLFGDKKVEGWENVPETGPVIFIANHLSNIDPAIVATLAKNHPGFLAKKELFSFPLFAVLLRLYGAHPLNRAAVDVPAIRWAMELLKQPNATLILFPEGTRNQKGDGMRRARPGATHIALRSGVPIIPIGIAGSESMQNVLRVMMPTAKVRIQIGAPFRLAFEGENRPTREEFEAMTTEIMVRVARLLPDTYRGYYQDQIDTRFVYTKEVDLDQSASIPASPG